jgi:hypothetical protein
LPKIWPLPIGYISRLFGWREAIGGSKGWQQMVVANGGGGNVWGVILGESLTPFCSLLWAMALTFGPPYTEFIVCLTFSLLYIYIEEQLDTHLTRFRSRYV